MPSSFTPNYNLEKPAQEDFYNVSVPNGNADKIDAALKTLADAIGGIDLTTLSQAIANVQNDLDEHQAALAKHNQFINAENKKIQVVLGWNKTFNCPTMDYVEVVE